MVRVHPNDTLSLRRSAAPDAPIVTTLAHDTPGLRPTGEVCRVGKIPWFQVTANERIGWVSGAFVMPATPPRDDTRHYLALAGAQPASSPEAMASSIVKSLQTKAQPEVPFQPEIIGIAIEKTQARLELWKCCYADDSMKGEQISITAKQRSDGWHLVSARVRFVCRRSVSGELCL